MRMIRALATAATMILATTSVQADSVTEDFSNIVSPQYQYVLTIPNIAGDYDDGLGIHGDLNSTTVIPAYLDGNGMPLSPSAGLGLIAPGINFRSTTPSGILFWQGANAYPGGDPPIDGGIFLGNGGGGYPLQIEFSVPVNMFALSLAYYEPWDGAEGILPQQQTVTVYDTSGALIDTIIGPVQQSDGSYPTQAYVSDTEDVDIGSIDIVGENFGAALSSITFGDPPLSQVPEPASLAIFGTALLGMWRWRR